MFTNFMKNTMTWAEHILSYHADIEPTIPLPESVEWIHPYKDPEVQRCMTEFYNRFFQDNKPRTLILGINPGRFGAGVTGIPFTDPVKLQQLGISNSFEKRRELSSDFIYDMIEGYGGPELFYSHFYLTAALPFGLLKNGKNLNYYDSTAIKKNAEPAIVAQINSFMTWDVSTEKAFCLGMGKNAEYLSHLNQIHHWWKTLVSLPHPRWILQYNRKAVREYIDQFVKILAPQES